MENGLLFAQRAHSACTARAQRTVRPHMAVLSPLRKHQESQKNVGQTGSQCLDKAVLARDVGYQPSQE